MVGVSFALELPFLDVLSNNIVMKLSWNYRLKGLGVSDECSHYILINRLMIALLDVWSRQVLVHACDVLCQSHILVLVLSVKQQEDQVKAREKSRW